MKEPVGGCGNADEFGDVCGESDYRTGELAINLCDQCTIANLRSNLKAERDAVKMLTADLARVSAERDTLAEARDALRIAVDTATGHWRETDRLLKAATAERDTWKARYHNKTLRFNAVRARAKVDMARLCELLAIETVLNEQMSAANNDLNAECCRLSLQVERLESLTPPKGDTGRGDKC